MYKIKVNERFDFDIIAGKDVLKVNGEEIQLNIEGLAPGHFHVLHNHKSYNTELVSENKEEKTAVIKVNGNIYQIAVEDQFDQLLKQLGMDSSSANKSLEIKAPMPGLVLNVLVSEGQEINKGDNLVVLEAMKMENMLKSATSGTVKQIMVSQGDKVEKSQVLIRFS